ncbi:MAG: diadenylate cyclase CdaA [Bacillota bacterium]|nr:diadenylate cyclase CdaA [Bacillota bacterium]
MDVIFGWFHNIIAVLSTIEIKDIVDILAIAFIIYSLFKLVRETRAEQLIKGILVLLVVYLISSIFNFVMLTSILKTFFEFSAILLCIVFQPEIRKALERIGQSKFSRKNFRIIHQESHSEAWIHAEKKAISDVCDACQVFQRSKTGALIVFERQTKLLDIAKTGTIINAQSSVAMIGNIFFNKAPLHDGAVIIRDGLIYAAGCILPLTGNEHIDYDLGTRHRSALGMSENSDAIVVVVSEENGVISLSNNGVLTRELDKQSLKNMLTELLIPSLDDTIEFLPIFSLKRKEKKSNGKK